MPSIYAHYRFGTALLPTLPADVRKTIQRFRGLYDMGLHGPDIFYYSSPVIHTGADYLGIKFHEQTGREFFSRVCRAVRLERSEGALAYLYGLLTHYCLDSLCHEVIHRLTQQENLQHMELETEFDRYLLEQDGKVPAYAQDLSPHISLTVGECETVSKFYPPAKPNAIRRCVGNMAFYTRLLASPDGVGRTVLEKGIRALPREIQGMLMGKTPNAACAIHCDRLMDAYRSAMEQFPMYLEQLREHMTYSAQFGGEFEKQFG